MASISDVNDLIPMALPENPNYDTISGLLNYIYGRIPAVNEKRIFGGYEFNIIKRFKHSVDSVKMTVVNAEQVDGEHDGAFRSQPKKYRMQMRQPRANRQRHRSTHEDGNQRNQHRLQDITA